MANASGEADRSASEASMPVPRFLCTVESMASWDDGRCLVILERLMLRKLLMELFDLRTAEGERGGLSSGMMSVLIPLLTLLFDVSTVATTSCSPV